MYNTIHLSKFLSRYVMLEGEKLKKITHFEVEKLFPNLKRSTFLEIKKHPELIYTGKVILVDDGKKVIPYYTPKVKKTIKMTIVNREEEEKEKIDDKVYDYASMSIYELKCLLQRKFYSSRNQSCARKELNKRGVSLCKKYKREKNNNYMEE